MLNTPQCSDPPAASTLIYVNFGGPCSIARADRFVTTLCTHRCAEVGTGRRTLSNDLRSHFHNLRSALRQDRSVATALVHCPSERVLEQAGRHIAVMVTAGIDAALALTSFAAMTTMTAHHALDLGDPDPLDVTTPATSELESFESSLELMLRGLDAVARA